MNNDLRVQEIKPALMSVNRQIQSLLIDENKAKKFMASALVVASSPALMKCSPDSIIQACVGVAMSDLNIDPNYGHCYIIPYWSREGSQAQLQIGYKGYIQLLFRAGWMIKAFPVFTCDKFSSHFDGWDDVIVFEKDIDARDEGNNDWVYENLRGVYVVARNVETGDKFSLFVNKTTIEKLRLHSQNQKISQYTKPDDKVRLDAGLPIGIWHDWYLEMAQAKAIKKLAKSLPIGDNRTINAIVADDKIEVGKNIDFKQSADTDMIIEGQAMPQELSIIDAIRACESIADLEKIKPKTKSEKIIYKAAFDALTPVPEHSDEEWE